MTIPPTFPALPGQGWSVHKRPAFATIVASHVSGREVRDALFRNPIWQFELTFDGLASDSVSYPGLGAESLQSLMGLFLQCQGQFGTFLSTRTRPTTPSPRRILPSATARRRTFHSRARSADSSSRWDG